MAETRTIAVVIGTRPEAIKMSPVVLALLKHPQVRCRVCVTGQHREMVDPILEAFGVQADRMLSIMRPDQSLARLTGRALERIDDYLRSERPDLVLAQGDTTTVLAATLASFYLRIPVGHVEAGLRTGDLQAPWPEEANRVLTARLATLHFAPTGRARANLLAEGVSDDSILVTGNTVIDALLAAVKTVRADPEALHGALAAHASLVHALRRGSRTVLITGHRRENLGSGLRSICEAVKTLSIEFPDVHFVYPVHLNPNVLSTVQDVLGQQGDLPSPNVHLVPPLSYLPFVALMDRACLILTDSGGVQEEAPSLGRPVLVLRDSTERPEAVATGAATLVGTDPLKIVACARKFLVEPGPPRSAAANPFGDGHASDRIARRCLEYLGLQSPPAEMTPALPWAPSVGDLPR